MPVDIDIIGAHKVINISNGEVQKLENVWHQQSVVIVFFRRWGCVLCRLWASELSEIASVLRRHNIKLIGVGVEEMGSTEFVEKQFFDGDLYYVKDKSTYNTLGFKKFNKVSILASLFWKQSREALSKGQDMGLGGDLKGDWGQTGGAVLVEKGGKLLTYFAQTGPGDHLPNLDILKHFGLENEYLPDKMGNKSAVERGECLAAAIGEMS